MAAAKHLEDLNLSNDEVKKLTNALKNEEFRKLLAEYAQEISDPENKRRYEEEISQMERERGMDVKFIHPDPGYALKTSINGDQKAFINVCKNDNIAKPSSRKQVGPDGQRGLSWNLPHSFAPPREDTDKLGKKCTVYDFVVHPDTYRMAESNARFKKMLNDTAFDGIERQFHVTVDRKNVKAPKMKFKGKPTATVIRTKKTDDVIRNNDHDPDDIISKFPYPYDNIPSDEKARRNEEEAIKREQEAKNQNSKTKKPPTEPESVASDSEFEIPNYSIKHRCDFDLQDFRQVPDANTSTRPSAIVIDVDLPLIKSTSQVNLDIFERRLTLQSTKQAKYKLDITLPYPVDENQGSAKFDKSKRKLIITLPVIPAEISKAPIMEEVPAGNQDCKSEEKECKDDGELENAYKVTDCSPMERPLVEVLSSEDAPDGSATTSNINGISSVDSITDDTCTSTQNGDPGFTLPSYDFHQDDETVSFIMHAGGIVRASVNLTVAPDNRSCSVQMTSIGSGGFPIHYRLWVQFPEDCPLEPQSCRVDVSDYNAVLLLVKAEQALGDWSTFQAGLTKDTLEEKVFVSHSMVGRELSQLEESCREAGGNTLDNTMHPKLEVTQMDNEKLTVHIQKTAEKDVALEPAEAAIEIVHSQEVPPLQSILKQRSRSMSESSDDMLSSSYGRQHSCSSSSSSSSIGGTGSEGSSLLESDEGSTSPGTKKSVSFNENVDKTMYKTNQSVSSMHTILKNKRKRQRKKEQRQQTQHARRRRKSSGSEPSSDDQSTGSQCSDDPSTDSPCPYGEDGSSRSVGQLDGGDPMTNQAGSESAAITARLSDEEDVIKPEEGEEDDDDDDGGDDSRMPHKSSTHRSCKQKAKHLCSKSGLKDGEHGGYAEEERTSGGGEAEECGERIVSADAEVAEEESELIRESGRPPPLLEVEAGCAELLSNIIAVPAGELQEENTNTATDGNANKMKKRVILPAQGEAEADVDASSVKTEPSSIVREHMEDGISEKQPEVKPFREHMEDGISEKQPEVKPFREHMEDGISEKQPEVKPSDQAPPGLSPPLIEEIATQGGVQSRAPKDDYAPETMLSWDDHANTTNKQHTTTCGVEFTNSMMFELDED